MLQLFLPRLLALVITLAGFVTPGFAQAGGQVPITIKDVIGRSVQLVEPATRVVILFNYEEFAAIVGPGAFEKIVGLDRIVWHDWRKSIWNNYVDAIPHIVDIPDVGDSYSGTFSVERVLALNPQIVIAPKAAAFPFTYPATGPLPFTMGIVSTRQHQITGFICENLSS